MVPLVVLGVLLAALALVASAGLAAARQPLVQAALRRIEPLSQPHRGRLGVWIARDPRVPALVRLLPIVAFVYWVIPLDVIPDPIPRVGYYDDRIALALAIWCVARWAARPLEEHLTRIEFLHEAALARGQASDEPLDGTSAADLPERPPV